MDIVFAFSFVYEYFCVYLSKDNECVILFGLFRGMSRKNCFWLNELYRYCSLTTKYSLLELVSERYIFHHQPRYIRHTARAVQVRTVFLKRWGGFVANVRGSWELSCIINSKTVYIVF